MVVYYFNRLYGTIRTVFFYTATRGHEKEVILLRTNWRFATKQTNRTLKAAELCRELFFFREGGESDV